MKYNSNNSTTKNFKSNKYNKQGKYNKHQKYNKETTRSSSYQDSRNEDPSVTKKRNSNIIKKVEEWQNFKFIKHLVCGKEGCQTELKAREINGKVVLQCPKCKEIQSYIPKVVLKTRFYISSTLCKLRTLYSYMFPNESGDIR